MGSVRRLLSLLHLARETETAEADARVGCDAIADAAQVFAERADGGIEEVLRATVRAVARMTGGAAILVVPDGDGRLGRLAAEGADGCTRETVSRPEVVVALLGRLRALGRPIGPADVIGVAGRTLAAIAPRGFLALPVGAGVPALLLVLEPAAGAPLDDDAVRVLTVLALVASAALHNAERLARLEESREELRRLAAHVLVSKDHELGRTSHALHEGVCQRLAAANAQLQALEPLLDADAQPARARLRDARKLVKQTLGELRELAQELRPSVLADFGYVHALRWYLDRLRDRAGVSHSLEVEGGETRLPLELEGALYRATEEALRAAALSTATRPLRVRVRQDPAAVQIEIAGPRPAALDVVAMRERLRPFGGAVRVGAAPDAATVIEVSIPPTLN